MRNGRAGSWASSKPPGRRPVELPLFPLNSVLFPGATLPLHIFEERYKLMIGRCLQSGAPFGVLLIRSGNEVGEAGEPLDVATPTRIVRVQPLDEGRMNLICLGERRFRLLKKLRETPYLVGEVEPLDSTDSEGDEGAGREEKEGGPIPECF